MKPIRCKLGWHDWSPCRHRLGNPWVWDYHCLRLRCMANKQRLIYGLTRDINGIDIINGTVCGTQRQETND